jgi:hypothetical protein
MKNTGNWKQIRIWTVFALCLTLLAGCGTTASSGAGSAEAGAETGAQDDAQAEESAAGSGTGAGTEAGAAGQEAGAEDSDERENSSFIYSAHHGGLRLGVAEDILVAVHFRGGLAKITVTHVGLDILPSAIGEHLKIFGARVVYRGVIVKAVDNVGRLAFFKVIASKTRYSYEAPAFIMHIAQIFLLFFVTQDRKVFKLLHHFHN